MKKKWAELRVKDWETEDEKESVAIEWNEKKVK